MAKQPLSAMDIISKAWQLYRVNFNLFLQPVVILTLIGILLLIPTFYEFPYQFVFFTITLLAYIIISIWITVVFYRMANYLHSDKKATLQTVYQESWSKTPYFFWISFLYGLVVLGGSILFIIPGIIWAVWYAFAHIIVAVEKKKYSIKEVFSQSHDLVRDRWWSTLWRLAAPQIFYNIIVMIVVFGLGAILTAGQIPLEQLSNNFYFNILSVIISSIFAPLMILPIVVLYNDLKKGGVKK